MEIVYCNHCLKRIPSDATTCNRCGMAVHSQAITATNKDAHAASDDKKNARVSVLTCKCCGNTISCNAAHCPKCGEPNQEFKHFQGLTNEQRVHVAAEEKVVPDADFLENKSTGGKKAKNFDGFYAIISSLVGTILVGYFVEPWVIQVFGGGFTWWMYLLFFVLLVGAVAKQLAKARAVDNIAYGEIRPRVVNTSRGTFCSKCGTATTSDDKFCPGCGNRRQ